MVRKGLVNVHLDLDVNTSSTEHPYAHLIDTLKDGIKFFNPRKLGDPRYGEFRPSNHVCVNIQQ